MPHKKLLPPSSGSIAFNWRESNNPPNVDGSTGDVAEAKEKTHLHQREVLNKEANLGLHLFWLSDLEEV